MKTEVLPAVGSWLLLACTVVGGCSGAEPAGDASTDAAASDDLGDTSTSVDTAPPNEFEPDTAPADDIASPETNDTADTPDAIPRDPLAWLTEPPAEGAEPKLLFIGVDGMRPDALEVADTPTFDRLRDNGTWTLTGTTQLTTSTDSSAGWVAITAGVDSTFTGVTDNDSLFRRNWEHPSFAKVLQDARGLEVVLAAHWLPFVTPIHEPGVDDDFAHGSDEEVTTFMANALATSDADLFLLHLDDLDAIGHATGFSADNRLYIEMIETIDALAARLVDAISARPGVAGEDWLVMVVTDHGGEGTVHGPMTPDCQTIPFVFAGGGGARGEFEATVSQLDVAPTVLAHFGASDVAPVAWQGVAR